MAVPCVSPVFPDLLVCTAMPLAWGGMCEQVNWDFYYLPYLLAILKTWYHPSSGDTEDVEYCDVTIMLGNGRESCRGREVVNRKGLFTHYPTKQESPGQRACNSHHHLAFRCTVLLWIRNLLICTKTSQSEQGTMNKLTQLLSKLAKIHPECLSG